MELRPGHPRRPSRVAVVTSFAALWEGYSLCGVVATQLRHFLGEGRETVFVASEGFVPSGVYADPRLGQARLPHRIWDGEDAPDRAWFARAVAEIRAALRPVIAATEVAITHDLMLLPQNLAWNAACRHLAAEFPHVRWLHWIHSAPTGMPAPEGTADPRRFLASPAPQARFVFPNRADAPLVARRYGVAAEEVAVVPHPFDPEDLGLDPLARAIADRLDLWSADVTCLYPGRIDAGKQVHRIVQLMAALKARGASVRLVIAGFHALAAHQTDQLARLKEEARARGLSAREMAFVHDLAGDPRLPPHDPERLRQELPHRAVLDLFRLSTLYIHPSVSEAFSLVAQEAAGAGALLVLNADAAAMREIYGEAALWLSFGAPGQVPDHPRGEEAFLAEAAEAILARLDAEATLCQRRRLRQEQHPAAVFARHLTPLLDGALHRFGVPA